MFVWSYILTLDISIYDCFDCFTRRGLHFIQINVRSLFPKIDKLTFLAQQTKASIIAVAKSWLDESIADEEIKIPDFIVERSDRNRNDGGVCIYIKTTVAYNRPSDLYNEYLETCFIDIVLPKYKPILVGAYYRPQMNSSFYDKLESMFLDSSHFL